MNSESGKKLMIQHKGLPFFYLNFVVFFVCRLSLSPSLSLPLPSHPLHLPLSPSLSLFIPLSLSPSLTISLHPSLSLPLPFSLPLSLFLPPSPSISLPLPLPLSPSLYLYLLPFLFLPPTLSLFLSPSHLCLSLSLSLERITIDI